jgi:hypothetical protein
MFIFNTDTCDHGEVTGLRFTFPSWDPLNLSIRWETHHHRFANVNEPQYYYCSSQIQPDDTNNCIACTTSNGDIDERGQNFKI